MMIAKVDSALQNKDLFCVLGLILLQMSTETLSGWTRWVNVGCIIGIKSFAMIALFSFV